ncbi:uncharacterized protein LOC106068177 [Biomphalaria glabrata]|uniref:Uncharacterized protein LOC106068177 n=1 Tax=Biomphalaria glabrata TaxID=6526 RepID=A0A9W2ZEY9_BIOGL|nr:uncharacterized protein LOC106068177 [Biomphalaria glabrata]
MKFELIYILVAMAKLTSGVPMGFDVEFCNKNMGIVTNNGTYEKQPVFIDNFHIVVEQKEIHKKLLNNIDEYFSQHSGRLYASLLSTSYPTQYWVDAGLDEVVMKPQDDVCSEKTTDFIGEDAYTMFGVIIGPHDSLEISPPAGFYHWNDPGRLNISYKGRDTSRGINTTKWWTCEYDSYRYATTFTEWHLADITSFQLPYVSPQEENPPVLPVSADITGVVKRFRQNDTYFHFRYDFTHVSRIQPDDEHFEIPANMFCMRMIYEDAQLPTIPEYFKFRGEQVNVNNTNAEVPDSPVLTLSIEEYNHRLGLYIQDIISTPVQAYSINDKAYLRMVDDFNTGLSYQINLESGDCQVSPIDGQSVDTIRMGNGLVQMRDTAAFFDLSPQSYRYIGIHEKRGIKCRVWTAFYGPDQTFAEYMSLYAWYFADPDWMKENGFRDKFSLPVALEITKGNSYTEFNLFEWTTVASLSHPDLSTCYDVNQTMNIQMTFKARFDQYYAPVKTDFRQGFYSALLKSTSLVSALRIADLDVQPSSTNQITVQFKLLDKLNITGDVVNATKQVASSVIYQQLVTAVDAGTFSVDVGAGKASAVIYAAVNSTSLVPPPHIRFIKPPPKQEHSSTGFSAGLMAAVGTGSLVFGLIVGISLVALVKRCRNIRSNDDLTLDKLSADTN